MQFYAPENFQFLWSLLVLLALFWLGKNRWHNKIRKFGNPGIILGRLIPSYRPSASALSALLVALSILFSTLALARPQWGEEKKKIQRKGIDVIFLMDTSLSMMAEDLKPNRLFKSKQEIKNLVNQLKGDRVGMIAFAGSSFLQSPLTLDYGAFFLFLDAVKTGHIPDPGTSLGQALTLAVKGFGTAGAKHKALVIFSDGEDHMGGIEEVLAEIKKSGIRIYAIGTGSIKGDPIPLKDESGRQAGFKKDRKGEIVITKLNAPLLEKLAQETGGLYLPATPGEREIQIIVKHMQSLDKQQFKEQLITEKEDHYQLFLFLAMVFLMLELLLKRSRKVPHQALAALLIFFLFTGFIQTPRGLNEEGNKSYEGKRYQSAIEAYRQAQIKNPKDPVIRYNLGNALYQTKDYQAAAQELEKAVSQSQENSELRAKALYNYGNTQYRLGNFDKAIESYQKSLEINPQDKDAKYNLEFLQNKKSMMDKKNEDKKQQKDDKPQQQQQSNNQQQNQQQEQSQDPNQQNQNQQQKQENQQEQQQNQQNDNPQEDQQQDQQDQQQDQQDQEQNQEQNPEQNEEQQQEQDQSNQSDGQEQDQNQQPKDQEEQNEQQEKEEEKQDQGKPDQPDPSGQPQPASQDEQQEPSEQPGQAQPRQPLQGQMTMENALQILEAMQESDKDLQDLRKPPVPPQPALVEKDW